MSEEKRKTVSLEDITVSNMYEIEALIRVLERKTHQEILEELKKIKEEK